MKIYPVNEQIEELIASSIDEESGELLIPDEELQKKIEEIQIDFDDKIVDLRNEYINLTAEAEALKAEKQKLALRQSRAEKQAERLKRWIAWLLKGEKFQKDAVRISYRRSEEVVFDDDNQRQFIEWADKNFPSLLSYKQPEPSKTEIKKAIKDGLEVSFAHIESKNNVQIK